MKDLGIVGNFIKATAKQMIHGFPTVGKEEFDRRIQICSECEFNKNNRCEKCGCFIRAKATLQTEICPLGKWYDGEVVSNNPCRTCGSV